MYGIAEPVARLIDEFVKLPGVGPKTAQRLAYHILRVSTTEAQRFSDAIMQVKERIVFCSECYNVTEQDPCSMCANQSRDRAMLCVVEEPLDVNAIERSGSYRGVYHVLHGVINPQDGIGPDAIKISELVKRVRAGGITEVIIATNPTMLGEATGNWILSQLRGVEVKVTRLARGLPSGGDLEYADDVTLARALEGRSTY